MTPRPSDIKNPKFAAHRNQQVLPDQTEQTLRDPKTETTEKTGVREKVASTAKHAKKAVTDVLSRIPGTPMAKAKNRQNDAAEIRKLIEEAAVIFDPIEENEPPVTSYESFSGKRNMPPAQAMADEIQGLLKKSEKEKGLEAYDTRVRNIIYCAVGGKSCLDGDLYEEVSFHAESLSSLEDDDQRLFYLGPLKDTLLVPRKSLSHLLDLVSACLNGTMPIEDLRQRLGLQLKGYPD